jgi:hypothetical protein
MKFKFREKHVLSIHNIGSIDHENDQTSAEVTFEEAEWAKEYCESFIYNLRVGGFNQSR